MLPTPSPLIDSPSPEAEAVYFVVYPDGDYINAILTGARAAELRAQGCTVTEIAPCV
jgi:hypothetical protein